MPYLDVLCALFPLFSAHLNYTFASTWSLSHSTPADQSDVLDKPVQRVKK